MSEKKYWTFEKGLKRSDGTPVPDHWRPNKLVPEVEWYDHFIPNIKELDIDKLVNKKRGN